MRFRQRPAKNTASTYGAVKTGSRIVEIGFSKFLGGVIDILSLKGLELLGNDFAKRLVKVLQRCYLMCLFSADAINIIK